MTACFKPGSEDLRRLRAGPIGPYIPSFRRGSFTAGVFQCEPLAKSSVGIQVEPMTSSAAGAVEVSNRSADQRVS